MTGLDDLLGAIEAEPADDARWLVLADWLEERGEPLADAVREAVGSGAPDRVVTWARLRQGVIHSLPHRRAQLVACDYFERLLSLYEGRYPQDPSPRRFIETMRRFGSGKSVDAATSALQRSWRAAYEDDRLDPRDTGPARYLLGNLLNLRDNPAYLGSACANLAAWHDPGRGSPDSPAGTPLAPWRVADETRWPAETPDSRSRVADETRWQVSRAIRYRLGG